MESLVADSSFWQGKKVFLTGHTGFKGSWLALWLHAMGARVHGYSRDIPTHPSLYESAGLASVVSSTTADIRDFRALADTVRNFDPEIVVHMAAQSLVGNSYRHPLETFSTNAMGTANLLNACREGKSIRVILNVTSDKCYENREWVWGYRENDRLGGHDPYSCSKACSELITRSFERSFFSQPSDPAAVSGEMPAVATARAGNVIGGGDWAEDRLVPDCIRAFIRKTPVAIRNPTAVRPWQYVLDPLNGYLLLIEKLYVHGGSYSGAWNFGPSASHIATVKWIADTITGKLSGGSGSIRIETDKPFHEARTLKLDASKAASLLQWRAMASVDRAIDEIVRWTRAYLSDDNVMDISIQQIESFLGQRD